MYQNTVTILSFVAEKHTNTVTYSYLVPTEPAGPSIPSSAGLKPGNPTSYVPRQAIMFLGVAVPGTLEAWTRPGSHYLQKHWDWVHLSGSNSTRDHLQHTSGSSSASSSFCHFLFFFLLSLESLLKFEHKGLFPLGTRGGASKVNPVQNFV